MPLSPCTATKGPGLWVLAQIVKLHLSQQSQLPAGCENAAGFQLPALRERSHWTTDLSPKETVRADLACGSSGYLGKFPWIFQSYPIDTWLHISTCSMGTSNQESVATSHAAWPKQSLHPCHFHPMLVRGTLAPSLEVKSPLWVRLWSETSDHLKGFPPPSSSSRQCQRHVSALGAIPSSTLSLHTKPGL